MYEVDINSGAIVKAKELLDSKINLSASTLVFP